MDNGVGHRSMLVSPKARWDQYDAGVRCIGCDGVASEYEKVDDVPGHDRAVFARGVVELGAVGQLAVADLVSARRVYAAPPEKDSNTRRQILIEIDLHRVRRTSPGCSFSTASGVSAAFASICA